MLPPPIRLGWLLRLADGGRLYKALKGNEVHEFPDPLVNVLTGGLRGGGDPEAFAAEGGGNASMNDGLP